MPRPMSINSPLFSYFHIIVDRALVPGGPKPYLHPTSSPKAAQAYKSNFAAYRMALREACDPLNKRYRGDPVLKESLQRADRIKIELSTTSSIVRFHDYANLPEYQDLTSILEDRTIINEMGTSIDDSSNIDSIEKLPKLRPLDKSDELIKTLYSTAPLTITPQTEAAPEPAPRRTIPRPPGADNELTDIQKRANLSSENSPPIPNPETKE